MEQYNQIIGRDLWREVYYECDRDSAVRRRYVARALRWMHAQGFRRKTVDGQIYFVRCNVETCVFHGYHLTGGCPIELQKETHYEHRQVA